jgi:hypothetical protein
MDRYKINLTIYVRASKIKHVFNIVSGIMKLVQRNFRENIVGMSAEVCDDDGY